MSLSYYNPHDRYRQRHLQRLMRICFFLALMSVFGGIGFWLGGMSADRSAAVVREKNQALLGQVEGLQREMTQMRAEVQTANARYEQLQAAYNEAIPEGPMRDLTNLIREQLQEGMDPEIIKFAVLASRPPRNCTDPETKRFVVSTPAYQGPDSEISIAEGAIRITGSGVSARNDKGDPEAWYDPAKSIDLVFISGGEEVKKSGTLPIQHTVILEDKQFRFTVEEGSRSFAKVTFDSCDYP